MTAEIINHKKCNRSKERKKKGEKKHTTDGDGSDTKETSDGRVLWAMAAVVVVAVTRSG